MRNSKVRSNSRSSRTAKASKAKKPASSSRINKRRIQIGGGGGR